MRLFIAADIPDWIKRKIGEAQRELPSDGITLVETRNLHITLKFLGEVNPKNIQKIDNGLRAVEHGKFGAKIEGVGAFPDENYVRVVWAGCESRELAKLAKKINEALQEFPAEEFTGHITIARVRKKIGLKNFFEKYRSVQFGGFKVEKFSLMGSELSPSGPKYSVIGEYELKGNDEKE